MHDIKDVFWHWQQPSFYIKILDKRPLHHHHQDIEDGRGLAVYMQIGVTLSVAFKGCKALHRNATQSFWWIPDAMTCPLSSSYSPFSFSLAFLWNVHIWLFKAKLYLFSLLPASGDLSLASTVELLSRCCIRVSHILSHIQCLSRSPFQLHISHHDPVQAGLLGEHQSVCGYRSVECILCRITLPRNMLDCHRLWLPTFCLIQMMMSLGQYMQ